MADNIFTVIFFDKNCYILFDFLLNLKVQLTNKPALVQIMIYQLTGDKPWSEPFVVQFTNYMHHSASISTTIATLRLLTFLSS